MSETETTIDQKTSHAQTTGATDHSSEVTAVEHGSEMHIPTLFSEPIFNLGNFTVTNSLMSSWLAIFVIVIFATAIRTRLRKVPKGLQNVFEVILEEALKLTDSVTGSRQTSEKFLPFVFTFFIFILLNNWLGLLPGVGSIGYYAETAGHQAFIPFFRGGTADLNTTLALALVAVIATHIASVLTINFWKYFNRFVPIELFIALPRKVFKEKDFTALLVSPIQFFVGLIELVGELAKVASLSFRLFGNIFAGEVLLGAMTFIFAYFLPLPFLFLEILVGAIQALIFAMLTLVFLTVLTTDHSSEAH